MHFVFCQISTQLINAELPDDIAAEYYRKQWTKPGYYKSEHFFELPLWIAEICGSLKHTELNYTTELCVITRPGQTLPNGDYYLFSVLDVNKAIIENIIRSNPNKAFITGGYASDIVSIWYDCDNVVYFDSVSSFIRTIAGRYVYDLDYGLFTGQKTIPRLTLSTGCKHRCKFCTVPNELIEYSTVNINKQIWAFTDLGFEYVYVNDKTFGQANNYQYLYEAYLRIKSYNSAFKGFIVQTTCARCRDIEFVKELKNLGVVVVELGVETYNDEILAKLNKPQTTRTIDEAITHLYYRGIEIIPNIIIGIDGENQETYANTMDFLYANWRRLFALNIYNLAKYDSADDDDKNELTVKDNSIDKQFYNEVFGLGLQLLRR